MVACAAGTVTVADLASRNGTYLNGEARGGGAAAARGVLKIGDFTLLFDPDRVAEFASADGLRFELEKKTHGERAAPSRKNFRRNRCG